MKILVIDDDPSLRKSLRIALETMQHTVTEARDREQATELLDGRAFDVALLDVRLGQESGIDLLPELLQLAPGLSVVVMTAYVTIDVAVDAMRGGAVDFLPKPFTPAELRIVLDRVARLRRLQIHVDNLEERLKSVIPEVELETNEASMRQTLDVAFKAAATDATILLRGESGTGKGVLARAIHTRSLRAEGPFVTVHCPSLSAELLESDLFGHTRGAFTGAVQETAGKVAFAEAGTLFLDEIGELPLALQPKLLRLLQDKQYERVGDPRPRTCNVRIIAATNRDLPAAVSSGAFREDLLYRLNIFELIVPPLRERRQDLDLLMDHLLKFFARQNNKPITGWSPQATEALRRYAWPGNIRELRNVVERGVILASPPLIGLADLPSQIGTGPVMSLAQVGAAITLEQLETEHIRRILASTSTLEDAATILGIDPSTLYRRRKRDGL